ncbi:MAG: ATP-binding protein [Planctomycetota bacterium]|jgi:Fe-S-cluster-containing hydrogenase component 2
MKANVMRKIVRIDEDKCNGCGLCVPVCAEGAIQIIDGKAKLMGENLCDGLGACLGECPQDAITIEERPAEPFDERAVEEHFKNEPQKKSAPPHAHAHEGCPGAMVRMLEPAATAAQESTDPSMRTSQLRQWPLQLALVPPKGKFWENADVLIAADCVAYAMGDFHERLLKGKTLVIACPKLDDVEPYVEKLAAIFAENNIRSVTVAHMEVPCCMGLLSAAEVALEKSGRTDIEIFAVQVGIDGQTANI